MMKDKILSRVREKGNVSFAELAHLLGEEAKGDLALTLKEYENIVLWMGMSEAFYEAVSSLLADEVIQLDSTIPLVYMIDGMALNLPIAKQKRNYKSLRWAPVVINLGPSAGA